MLRQAVQAPTAAGASPMVVARPDRSTRPGATTAHERDRWAWDPLHGRETATSPTIRTVQPMTMHVDLSPRALQTGAPDAEAFPVLRPGGGTGGRAPKAGSGGPSFTGGAVGPQTGPAAKA